MKLLLKRLKYEFLNGFLDGWRQFWHPFPEPTYDLKTVQVSPDEPRQRPSEDPAQSLRDGKIITCFTCTCRDGSDVGRSFRYHNKEIWTREVPGKSDTEWNLQGWVRTSIYTPEELISNWTGVRSNHTWMEES
jgi:hypothetical protein